MSHLAIGHLYTALHAACASAVARVVEANGVDVSFIDLGSDEREDALESQEVDLLVSFWTPQDQPLERAGREVIGQLYQPQPTLARRKKEGSSSPENWPQEGYSVFLVAEDLLPLAQKIQQAQPELAQLPLEKVGEGALFERVQGAGQAGEENPLVLAWQPHAVFHGDLLEILPDPQNLLGSPQEARMLLRAGLREEMDEDLLDELSGMMLGNRVMSALDYAVSIEGVDPDEAAEAWQRGRLLGR
ncbi:glycine betaine ABC transporter substrate-binding protein [Oecophyllibacter saccharovorans]|uniref:glycine betaine ABC transporter substrate-binding protein n=1 Tax=Oecophyllibacter saccharovorans TaxID=2558360 RepID=UPI0011683B61|nr:glycine betaine ABC transporter substrate-binding protein [Oecophyllibacter saccharovorans]TPW34733.1 hypothetical protein E3203_04120 [Oecophyllibacter saccharovorans]